MLRKQHRTLLTLTLLFAAAGASADHAVAAPPDRPATQPAPKTDWVRHYYDRVDLFEKENAAARNIVMVGSSHVEGFKADKLLPGRRVVNRGIASDRIGIGERGVLHRLDSSVFDCNPGVVILENGVNDLGEIWRTGKPSIDDVDKCYREVVRRIRTRLGDTPLVIVGLFPTRDRYAGLKPLIVEFNGRLARIASDFDCPFIDVYTPFADDEGLLRPDLSRDGLHLNPEGYRLWAERIEKVLARLDTAKPTASRPAESNE